MLKLITEIDFNTTPKITMHESSFVFKGLTFIILDNNMQKNINLHVCNINTSIPFIPLYKRIYSDNSIFSTNLFTIIYA